VRVGIDDKWPEMPRLCSASAIGTAPASPEASGIKEGSMRAVRLDLERKRRALGSAIQSSVGATRETDVGRELLKDPYGSASLTHDDEIAAAVVERRARELKEVNRALEEMDAGRYGICQDCGEAIAEARLRALPFATRCLACQAELEATRRAA
jgi:DnaK suppressor protein